MIDELQDPLRQGVSVRFNPDGSMTALKGRMRCCRCDTMPMMLFGLEPNLICHDCQIAIYRVGYAAFAASRETPTYVEPPKWWQRKIDDRVGFVVLYLYAALTGFTLATIHLARAWP